MIIYRLPVWTTFLNGKSPTKPFREHLKTAHCNEWKQAVFTNKLKGWESVQKDIEAGDIPRPAFTLEGFYRRLLEWLVCDDMVCDLTVKLCLELIAHPVNQRCRVGKSA